MTSNKTFLLAAGGTGGHVFPAVATAEELQKRGHRVFFATDKRGEKYLTGRGFEYKIISSASPTGALRKRFKALFQLLFGMVQSGIYIGKIRPNVVVGFGGYPSFPPLLAAKINLLKSVLHEQNSVLGKANRFLAKYASLTAISFSETINAKNAKLVGNPVRDEVKEIPYPPIDGKINVLITGGSQGASLFSKVLPDILTEFADRVNVVHQVRKEDIEEVRGKYYRAGMKFEAKSFFDDMPEQLASAHLVICRSGASTIFELAKVGRPAIFVPLATSAENHQHYNAKAAADIGGGWIIPEKNFNKTAVSAMLLELLQHPQKMVDAANNIKKLNSLNAAAELADLIELLA